MKRLNNEQILDIIYDLADANGMKITDFLAKVEEQFGEKQGSLEGLPQEIADELKAAREDKKALRKDIRQKQNKEEIMAEIKRFRELFPDVSPDDIPEEVWEDVSNGASLTHAYALFELSNANLNAHAKNVNELNSRRGAAAASDGSTEPSFTKEQVERMSGKDIKSNYKNILKAMKNWKFN